MTRYPRTVCELYVLYTYKIHERWKWCDFQIRGWVAFYYEANLFSTYWTPIAITKFGQLNLRHFTSEWSAHEARSMLTWSYLFESIACPQCVCTAISNHKKKFLEISFMMNHMWSDQFRISGYSSSTILIISIPLRYCFIYSITSDATRLALATLHVCVSAT